MSKVMAYTVVVRDPARDDTPHAVLAGKPVPDWAKDLVHADDLVSEAEYADEGSDDDDASKGFGAMNKAELEAEVAARNAARPEEQALDVGKGTVKELRAALEADAANG